MDKPKKLDSTDLSHELKAWWNQVAQRLIPAIDRKLRLRFGSCHGVSASQATSSAVRTLLESTDGEVSFESLEDLQRWLYTVAWRKMKDALKKEHFELRVAPDVESVAFEKVVNSGCDEACDWLAEFRSTLDDQERMVLDGKLEERTLDDIAQKNDLLKKTVHNEKAVEFYGKARKN